MFSGQIKTRFESIDLQVFKTLVKSIKIDLQKQIYVFQIILKIPEKQTYIFQIISIFQNEKKQTYILGYITPFNVNQNFYFEQTYVFEKLDREDLDLVINQ